jgi:hydroxymethylbilane synthase
LRDGNYDAILLAKAGVSRLNIDLSDFQVVTMDPTQFVPAPAQGVLGLQVRAEDHDLIELLGALDNKTVRAQIAIERRVLNQLDGGCQLPLGVYCPSETKAYVAFSNSWSEPAYRNSYEGDNLAAVILEDLVARKA